MGKKVIGILVVGLLIATVFPVGSAYIQKMNQKESIMKMNKTAPQIEITIKGGFGIQAIIKNIGTIDLNDANMGIVLDGSKIFPAYKDRVWIMDLEAGKAHWVIIPVLGFGATNIELTVDTTTETASGKVLGYFIFGVK